MKAKWDLEAERDIFRAICSPNHWFNDSGEISTHPKSLWWFVQVAWGAEFFFSNHPEQPVWLTEEIHGPYLEWLQTHILRWKAYCKSGGTDRYYLCINMPRGFGKTVTSTKSAMLWAHLDEPDMSTLIASATGSLSQDIYKAMQAVMDGDDPDAWFTWLYGNWRKGAKEWTKEFLHHGYRKNKNLSEPSFDVTSVDVGMTGYHHRIHIWDDPIFKNKLREGRDAYLRSVHDAVNASYNALQTNGLLIFSLTRYLDNDVAGKHLRDEGIATWSGMPCPNMSMFEKVPMGQGIWHVYFFQTEDELTGKPTHPTLMDAKKIKEAKARDPEDFACQQQNNPGTGERAPLLESQLADLFIDYKDYKFDTPIECASVHIDTAFKRLDTVRTGDDSAIVVWLHDARRNGVMYLDTDLLRASNEWREEDFNSELIKVLLSLRRRQIRVKALTDEIEPGGKSGTYKNRLLSVVNGVGISLPFERFIQLNRTTNKKARIRTGIGFWVENYVRILLHKDASGEWIIPMVVRKLFNQILRIDVVDHDDLADAATDGFTPGIWVKPSTQYQITDEGAVPRSPWGDDLRAFSKPPSIEEVYEMIDQQREVQWMGPGHGPDIPMEPFDNELEYPRVPI